MAKKVSRSKKDKPQVEKPNKLAEQQVGGTLDGASHDAETPNTHNVTNETHPKEYAARINQDSLSHSTDAGSAKSNISASRSKGSTRIKQDFHPEFLKNAGLLLSFATGICILMLFATFLLPLGNEAIGGIGGRVTVEVPMQTAQWAVLLDTLFPLFYGSGFTMLAVAFQSRGNRPLVRVILTGLLFVVMADFAENALAFKAMTGGAPNVIQAVLTMVKYGMLALSGILISTLVPSTMALGRLVTIILRFVFPIAIAILVSDLGGELGAMIIGASFPIILMVLAAFAMQQNVDNPSS